MAEKTGDTRFGHHSGSGANEPRRHEKKEQDPGWQHDQGGNQTRGDHDPTRDGFTKPGPSDASGDRSQGKETRGKDEVATRRHLEGSEQGPQ
jgi:hypothetical protein